MAEPSQVTVTQPGPTRVDVTGVENKSVEVENPSTPVEVAVNATPTPVEVTVEGGNGPSAVDVTIPDASVVEVNIGGGATITQEAYLNGSIIDASPSTDGRTPSTTESEGTITARTDAMQAILDRDGVLYLPDGVYDCNQLTVPNFGGIIGQSEEGTVLYGSTPTDVIVPSATCTEMTLKNFSVLGHDRVVRIEEDGTDVKITMENIYHTGAVGLLTAWSSDDAEVDREITLNMRDCTNIGESTGEAVYIEHKTGDVTIEDCVFNLSRKRAVMVGNDDDLPDKRGHTTVRNCSIDGITYRAEDQEVHAIWLFGGTCEIVNNRISNLEGGEDRNGCEGIYTKVKSGRIAGNRFIDAGWTAINLKGGQAGVDAWCDGWMIVEDNHIRRTTAYLDEDEVEQQDAGIAVFRSHCDVRNNHIQDCKEGIYVDGGYTDRKITGNVIDTCEDPGIYLYNPGSRTLVTDNLICNCDNGSSVHRGIRAYFRTTDEAQEDILIARNRFLNPTGSTTRAIHIFTTASGGTEDFTNIRVFDNYESGYDEHTAISVGTAPLTDYPGWCVEDSNRPMGEAYIYHVEDYGAIGYLTDPGSGYSYSDTALTTIIAAIKASGRGGVILFPCKAFYFEDEILVENYPGIEFRGVGGHRRGNTDVGDIATVWQKTATEHNFRIYNSDLDGPYCYTKFTNLNIRGDDISTFEVGTAACIFIDDSVAWTTYLDVQNCWLHEKVYGIRGNLSPDTRKGIGRFFIMDNTIEECLWGIMIDALGGTNTVGNIVFNNIRACGDTYTAEDDYNGTDHGGGVWLRKAISCNVSNNTLEASSTGLRLGAIGEETVYSCICDGNYFEANKTCAVNMEGCHGVSMRNQWSGKSNPDDFPDDMSEQFRLKSCSNIDFSGTRYLDHTFDPIQYLDGPVIVDSGGNTDIKTSLTSSVETATTANLDNEDSNINTVHKHAGRMVHNTDTHLTVFAGGSAAADVWYDSLGNTINSPV